MSLSSLITQTAKQKIVPATVVDVLGSSCSVQLSTGGQVLKNLSYYGPKPAVGDDVMVDYKTSIPTVITAGAEFAQIVNQYISTVVGGGSTPSNPTSPSDHNSLSGIQGGQDGEYYHLTAAQWAAIANSLGVETTDEDRIDNIVTMRFNPGSISEISAGKVAIGSGLTVTDTNTTIQSVKVLGFTTGRMTNNGDGTVTIDVSIPHVTDSDTIDLTHLNALHFGDGLVSSGGAGIAVIKDMWGAIGASMSGATDIAFPGTQGGMSFTGDWLLWAGAAAKGSAPFRIAPNGDVDIKGGNIALGSGDNIVRLSDDDGDNYALWVGAAAAAGAAFRVLKTGEVWILNGHVKVDMQSDLFLSGYYGWQILQDGNAEFNNVTLRGKLIGTVFETKTISGIAGQMVVTVADVLLADVDPADTTILVEQGQFVAGDIIHLKAAFRSEWMHVLDNGSEEYEGYLYNVERSIEGDAAEQWYAGESIFREGNAVLYEEIGRFGDPLGTFGDMEFGGNAFTYSGGQLSLYGESDYGPYFGVVRRIGSGYDQVAHAVRMGNLKDFLDITNEHYGIGIGDTSHFMRYTPEDGLLFRTALGGTQIDDDGVTTNSLNILESPVPEEFVEGQATLYVAGDEIIVHYNDKETVLNKLNGMAPIMHDDISSDRVIQVTLNGTVSLTATDMASVRIPTALSGMYLVEVAAHCGKDNTTGQSTSGAVQISVQNGTQNMLSSNLYIDAGQYDSSNSASPAAIDTDHDDIAAGNVINVEVVSAGVGVTYLTVTLVFRSPVV